MYDRPLNEPPRFPLFVVVVTVLDILLATSRAFLVGFGQGGTMLLTHMLSPGQEPQIFWGLIGPSIVIVALSFVGGFGMLLGKRWGPWVQGTGQAVTVVSTLTWLLFLLAEMKPGQLGIPLYILIRGMVLFGSTVLMLASLSSAERYFRRADQWAREYSLSFGPRERLNFEPGSEATGPTEFPAIETPAPEPSAAKPLPEPPKKSAPPRPPKVAAVKLVAPSPYTAPPVQREVRDVSELALVEPPPPPLRLPFFARLAAIVEVALAMLRGLLVFGGALYFYFGNQAAMHSWKPAEWWYIYGLIGTTMVVVPCSVVGGLSLAMQWRESFLQPVHGFATSFRLLIFGQMVALASLISSIYLFEYQQADILNLGQISSVLYVFLRLATGSARRGSWFWRTSRHAACLG